MTQKLLPTPVEGTVELLRDIMLRVAVMDGFLQNDFQMYYVTGQDG